MSKKEEAPSRGRSEAASEDNRRRDILRDIWKQFVTCLRPDPESDLTDSGRGHEKRDVKKSVWSYRPYDVF